MLWPVAALAVLLCTFAIGYGSLVQSRIKAALAVAAHDPRSDATADRDPLR